MLYKNFKFLTILLFLLSLLFLTGCAKTSESTIKSYNIEKIDLSHLIIEENIRQGTYVIDNDYILNNYYYSYLETKLQNIYNDTNSKIIIYIDNFETKDINIEKEFIFDQYDLSKKDFLLVVCNKSKTYSFILGADFELNDLDISKLLTLSADYTINFYEDINQYQYFISIFVSQLKKTINENYKETLGLDIPEKFIIQSNLDEATQKIIDEAISVYNNSLYFSITDLSNETYSAKINGEEIHYKKLIYDEKIKNKEDALNYFQDYYTTKYIDNYFIDCTNYILVNDELCWNTDNYNSNQSYLYHTYKINNKTDTQIIIDVEVYYCYSSDLTSYQEDKTGKMYKEIYPIILKKNNNNQFKVDYMVYWI